MHKGNKTGGWQRQLQRVTQRGQDLVDWLAGPRFTRLLGWGLGVRDADDGPIPLDQVANVLVVRLDAIGDWVLTSAMLRELRRALPRARIVQVVRPSVFDLARHCEFVDQTLVFDSQTARRSTQGPVRQLRALGFARRHLWRTDWDLALVPRWDFDIFHATMLAYLSRARWRIGFSERVSPGKARRNRGYDRLFTHPLFDVSPLHERERSLRVLKPLGIEPASAELGLTVPAAERQSAEVRLRHRLTGRPVRVVIPPGAGHPRRVWPAQRFAALLDRLAERYPLQLVLIGGPDEVAAAESIEQAVGCPVVNLVGEASLVQAAGFIAAADLLIGNDSGPGHIACALGVPAIVISCHPADGDPRSSNAPQRFGPVGARARCLQPAHPTAPCVGGCRLREPHCILGVSVEAVFDAAVEAIEAGPA